MWKIATGWYKPQRITCISPAKTNIKGVRYLQIRNIKGLQARKGGSYAVVDIPPSQRIKQEIEELLQG